MTSLTRIAIVWILAIGAIAGCRGENDTIGGDATGGGGGGGAGNTNSAPTISGVPASYAVADESYLFEPQVTDVDGDVLTFSVQNRPAWATFDPATGTLAGVPRDADVGVTSAVTISVSDGNESVSLAPFDLEVVGFGPGAVTLSLAAPLEYEDGSALTDLAGYRIYYGVREGDYPHIIEIANPGISSYVVDNLTPNTYYFVATAFNSMGAESDYSNVVVEQIR